MKYYNNTPEEKYLTTRFKHLMTIVREEYGLEITEFLTRLFYKHKRELRAIKNTNEYNNMFLDTLRLIDQYENNLHLLESAYEYGTLVEKFVDFDKQRQYTISKAYLATLEIIAGELETIYNTSSFENLPELSRIISLTEFFNDTKANIIAQYGKETIKYSR